VTVFHIFMHKNRISNLTDEIKFNKKFCERYRFCDFKRCKPSWKDLNILGTDHCTRSIIIKYLPQVAEDVLENIGIVTGLTSCQYWKKLNVSTVNFAKNTTINQLLIEKEVTNAWHPMIPRNVSAHTLFWYIRWKIQYTKFCYSYVHAKPFQREKLIKNNTRYHGLLKTVNGSS